MIVGIVAAVLIILDVSGVLRWESQIIRTGFLLFSSLQVSIGSSGQSTVRGEQTALVNEMIEGQKVVQAFGHDS